MVIVQNIWIEKCWPWVTQDIQEKKLDFVTSLEVVLSDSEAGIAQVALELTVMLSAGIPLW